MSSSKYLMLNDHKKIVEDCVDCPIRQYSECLDDYFCNITNDIVGLLIEKIPANCPLPDWSENEY